MSDISNEMSFQSVYSEKLPNQKLEIIKKYNLKYNTMIGDGINDSPLFLNQLLDFISDSTGVVFSPLILFY